MGKSPNLLLLAAAFWESIWAIGSGGATGAPTA